MYNMHNIRTYPNDRPKNMRQYDKSVELIDSAVRIHEKATPFLVATSLKLGYAQRRTKNDVTNKMHQTRRDDMTQKLKL